MKDDSRARETAGFALRYPWGFWRGLPFLMEWHDLNGIDAQGLQIVELLGRLGEGALRSRGRVERANVQLVDEQFVEVRRLEGRWGTPGSRTTEKALVSLPVSWRARGSLNSLLEPLTCIT